MIGHLENQEDLNMKLKEILESLCEECDGKGYHEYGGMAMEDDLVEKEPCTNELHERLPIALAKIEGLIPEKQEPMFGFMPEKGFTAGYNRAIEDMKANLGGKSR